LVKISFAFAGGISRKWEGKSVHQAKGSL